MASSGGPFSAGAIRRAADLAAGEGVAVLSILRVYGSAFGLPNPGLMPSRREREEQLGIVRRAVQQLERKGHEADGQVAATRSAGKMIAKVALARSAAVVVIDVPVVGAARQIVEGDLAGVLRRRLPATCHLEVMERASPKRKV